MVEGIPGGGQEATGRRFHPPLLVLSEFVRKVYLDPQLIRLLGQLTDQLGVGHARYLAVNRPLLIKPEQLSQLRIGLQLVG